MSRVFCLMILILSILSQFAMGMLATQLFEEQLTLFDLDVERRREQHLFKDTLWDYNLTTKISDEEDLTLEQFFQRELQRENIELKKCLEDLESKLIKSTLSQEKLLKEKNNLKILVKDLNLSLEKMKTDKREQIQKLTRNEKKLNAEKEIQIEKLRDSNFEKEIQITKLQVQLEKMSRTVLMKEKEIDVFKHKEKKFKLKTENEELKINFEFEKTKIINDSKQKLEICQNTNQFLREQMNALEIDLKNKIFKNVLMKKVKKQQQTFPDFTSLKNAWKTWKLFTLNEVEKKLKKLTKECEVLIESNDIKIEMTDDEIIQTNNQNILQEKIKIKLNPEHSIASNKNNNTKRKNQKDKVKNNKKLKETFGEYFKLTTGEEDLSKIESKLNINYGAKKNLTKEMQDKIKISKMKFNTRCKKQNIAFDNFKQLQKKEEKMSKSETMPNETKNTMEEEEVHVNGFINALQEKYNCLHIELIQQVIKFRQLDEKRLTIKGVGEMMSQFYRNIEGFMSSDDLSQHSWKRYFTHMGAWIYLMNEAEKDFLKYADHDEVLKEKIKQFYFEAQTDIKETYSLQIEKLKTFLEIKSFEEAKDKYMIYCENQQENDIELLMFLGEVHFGRLCLLTYLKKTMDL